VLELYNLQKGSESESGAVPIATYKESHRDWSVPPPALVIHKASLEVASIGITMLEHIILSLIIIEVTRVGNSARRNHQLQVL